MEVSFAVGVVNEVANEEDEADKGEIPGSPAMEHSVRRRGENESPRVAEVKDEMN